MIGRERDVESGSTEFEDLRGLCGEETCVG